MLSQVSYLGGHEAMFRVEDVKGKGKGCLASRRIEEGELILREAPTLLLRPRLSEGENEEDVEDEELETLEAFQAMSSDHQTAFLHLANMFNNDRERSGWPTVMVEYKESIREDVKKALGHGIAMDLEVAVEVVEIKETNSFHNGVFLRLSRFNTILSSINSSYSGILRKILSLKV